jgi:hypothetical protein
MRMSSDRVFVKIREFESDFKGLSSTGPTEVLVTQKGCSSVIGSR